MTPKKKPAPPVKSSVIAKEIDLFSALSDSWWDETGHFAPLHKMNPCRLGFIKQEIVRHFNVKDSVVKPYAGLSFLDIGCGGGLVCEPLARLGGNITGIDASDKAITTARQHAAQTGLTIDYRIVTAEKLVKTRQRFDVITALEIIEHVADLNNFMASVSALLEPNGLIIVSTVNRNTKSFLKAIVVAEYVLRWVPRGTHDWNRFVKPHELTRSFQQNGINVQSGAGMIYSPLNDSFTLDPHNLDVNYILCGKKDIS